MLTKIRTWVIVLSIVVMAACQDNGAKPCCDVQDPVNEFPWLKRLSEDLDSNWGSYAYIQQGTLDGRTVFVVNSCCWYCKTRVDAYEAYDCDGNKFSTDLESVENLKTVWKAEDNTCKLD